MVTLFRIQIVLILLFESVAFAHGPRAGDIWASIGPYSYQTQTLRHLDSNAPRWGVGLIVQGDIDTNGGVEIGMLYVDKLYVLTQQQNVLAERIKRMYVTTGYRHWISPSFSGALAVFSSYAMGDVKTVWTSETAQELKTTAHKLAEYGMDLSFQWEVFSTDHMAIVVDCRYSKSLSAKKDEDADQLGAMLAFKYLLPKPKQ